VIVVGLVRRLDVLFSEETLKLSREMVGRLRDRSRTVKYNEVQNMKGDPIL